MYSETSRRRQAVGKIKGVVSMKIAIEDNKRSNIPVVGKRRKKVSQRRGIDKTKSF